MQNTIEKPKTRETVSLNINTKRLLPQLLWVLKARSKDKTRPALSYMLVDNDGIVCTDGKRMHLFTNKELLPKLENGLYDVIVTPNNITFLPIESLEFPNYKQVIPNYEGIEPVAIPLNSKDISYLISSAIVNIFKSFVNGVDYEYLKDLSGENWHIRSRKDQAIEFKSGCFYALIMPIRL